MMDMKLKPFDFAAAVARAGLRTDGTPIAGGAGAAGAAKGTSKADFGSALTSALKSVSDSQNEATRMQNELQLDNRMLSDIGLVRGDIDWVADELAERAVHKPAKLSERDTQGVSGCAISEE